MHGELLIKEALIIKIGWEVIQQTPAQTLS
jgi:hypothetical protein